MTSRARLLARVCLAAAVSPVVGGCLATPGSTKQKVTFEDAKQPEAAGEVAASAKRQAGDVTPPPPPHDAAVEAGEGEDAAIEALRRKSEAYAQALEILMRERDAAPPAAAPSAEPVPPSPSQSQSPSRGSAVQWLDPSQFKIAMGDPSTEPQKQPQRKPPLNKDRAVAAAAPAEPTTKPVTVIDDSNTPLALAGAAEKQPTIAMITPSPSVDLSGTAGEDLDDHGALSTKASPSDAAALLDRLSRRVKENPRDIASHLEQQLLLFLLDEQVPNLAAIAPLPQEDRELVTAVLDGVANLRATLRRDANLLIAEKIRPVVELSDRLRTSAELTIPTMTLCSKVDGFGRYDAMEPRFIAGRDNQTIVYCEIENFSSQFEQGQWQTNLSIELSLFTEMGQQVYVESPAAIADTSRSRRHDFFVRKLIKLPGNLIIGRYVLKVTIVDTQGNRVAESSLPIQVVAN